MSHAVRAKLVALREALAEIEPYPWDGVLAWKGAALGLLAKDLGEHGEQFEALTTAPRWAGPVNSAGKESSDASSDDAALKTDRRIAAMQRDQLLDLLDEIISTISAEGSKRGAGILARLATSAVRAQGAS
jgi:hypothetical protein